MMEELIKSLKDYTQAVNALAESNMALVACLVDDRAEEDGEPMRYMDGTPCQ